MDIDEDVVLKNSPLDKYLEQFNEPYSQISGKDEGNSPKNQTYFVPNYKHLDINNYLYKSRINSLVNFIHHEGIFDDIDTDQLDCILKLNDANCAIKSNSIEISFIGMIFLSILIGFFMEHFYQSIIISISLLILWLFIKLSIGYLLSYIFKLSIKYRLKITIESRNLILLLQEIMSLNHGYNKLVNISDDINQFDISLSINKNPIISFSKRLYFLIESFQYKQYDDNCYIMKKFINIYNYSLDDINWINELNSKMDYIDDELNENKPLLQLKLIHNHCHNQSLNYMKILILIIINFNNYFTNILIIFKLFTIIMHDRLFLLNIRKCRGLLSPKSIKNTNEQKNKKLNKTNFNDYIQSYQLHLLELTSFIDIFENDTESINEILLNKCKLHINGLNNCIDGMNNLIQEKNEKSNNYDKEIQNTTNSFINEHNDELIKEVDDYEVLDEVLEAVIDPNCDDEQITSQVCMDIDTFEEKSRQNAKSLLNELQSVISIKAAEWKEREKIALQRREAEGKFVLKENLDDENSHLSYVKNKVNGFGDRYSQNDYEERKRLMMENTNPFLFNSSGGGGASFAEMIMKQRNLIQSCEKDDDDDDENIFEDET